MVSSVDIEEVVEAIGDDLCVRVEEEPESPDLLDLDVDSVFLRHNIHEHHQDQEQIK